MGTVIIARAIKSNEFESIYYCDAGEDFGHELEKYFNTPKKVKEFIASSHGLWEVKPKKFGSITELTDYSKKKYLYLFMHMRWYCYDGKEWIRIKHKLKKLKKLKYADFWNIKGDY